jgi:hypothetical protein
MSKILAVKASRGQFLVPWNVKLQMTSSALGFTKENRRQLTGVLKVGVRDLGFMANVGDVVCGDSSDQTDKVQTELGSEPSRASTSSKSTKRTKT